MNRNERKKRPDFEEQLRMENDIIKMKLMLEYGASFSPGRINARMNPAIEHAFLKHVLAMEEVKKQGKTITIFEKLGSPDDIAAPEQLSTTELPAALKKLEERLAKHGIKVKPVEKDIDPADFYRFLSTELMQMKIADENAVDCFLMREISDQDGQLLERIAVQEGLQGVIAGNVPMGKISAKHPLRLNGFEHYDRTSVQHRLMRYRAPFNDVLGLDKKITRTILEQETCAVHGTHATALCLKDRCEIIRGDWYVSLERTESDDWRITEIDIDGLKL
jgi:hypothetical protein